MQPATTESFTHGTLAVAPFFILVDSALTGLVTGMLLFAILLTNLVFFLPLRYCFPAPYRLLVLLIFNSALALVLNVLLQAHAYTLFEQLGSLLPLLALNGLVISCSEQLFARPSLKENISIMIYSALLMLPVFTLYGGLREVLGDYTLFADVAAYTDFNVSGYHFSGGNDGIAVFSLAAGALFMLGGILALLKFLTAAVTAKNIQ